ncbi:flowering time control protein FCA isoform X2 [Amborella trichopoda]|uniref:flowering time control protein FCA isoform X2 n=1 Tax=Amborella trichopoda TaxID=13333 RepID=UPI0009C07CA2|nr:flowering time control protein FCA isoform X2 [Amborella trichopoda]|eukprot:XP_020530557.1 flowering time control protein FCA isoform X2 [Amborella trichopoda]
MHSRSPSNDIGRYPPMARGPPPPHHQASSMNNHYRPMSSFGGSAQPPSMAGQKRDSSGFSVPLRGSSPDSADGGNYAKLFIGSVPRTATEEDIRPLFAEHGDVLEVALIKDKRTGQQQGCCFIKYATKEEADRAIRSLHNQRTLPGGSGPIQVRYADGERERLGAVEYKLFVGSLNKQATEKEIEEIFAPYGRVDDVYIMRDDLKQSRCGFVKYPYKDMAIAAINALNGNYVMRGCDQPLTVRFADPKRPRTGDSRGGPAFGGPGFGPRSQGPQVARPMPNLGGHLGGRIPPNAWHPMSPQNMGPSPQAGSLGVLGPPTNGSLQGPAITSSSTAQPGFHPPLAPIPHIGQQQQSPLQKPLQSPQHLPSSLQLPVSSASQPQTSVTSSQPLGQQLPSPQSVAQLPFSHALQQQQLFALGAQLSASQPLHLPTTTQPLIPSNLQPHSLALNVNQPQQLVSSTIQPQTVQPNQQSPAQHQALVQHQAIASQANILSQQQAFSHLQQLQQSQLQQQTSQSQKLQSYYQVMPAQLVPQSPWTGVAPQNMVSTPAVATAAVAPSAISAVPTVPVSTQSSAVLVTTCNWTEHTSPEGYKYYYNSVTGVSKWEKPEEFAAFEQQQQTVSQQLHAQPQTQVQSSLQPTQQVSPANQLQPQNQPRQQQQQLPQQQPNPSAPYLASGILGHPNIQGLNYMQLHAAGATMDPSRLQQGLQTAQDLVWKSKPAGN